MREKVTKNTVRQHRRFPERSRKAIQAAMLLDRLILFCLGKLELTALQVSAHKYLIGKCLPDLKALEVSGTVEHSIEVTREVLNGELAAMGIDPELEWQRIKQLPPIQ